MRFIRIWQFDTIEHLSGKTKWKLHTRKPIWDNAPACIAWESADYTLSGRMLRKPIVGHNFYHEYLPYINNISPLSYNVNICLLRSSLNLLGHRSSVRRLGDYGSILTIRDYDSRSVVFFVNIKLFLKRMDTLLFRSYHEIRLILETAKEESRLFLTSLSLKHEIILIPRFRDTKQPPSQALANAINTVSFITNKYFPPSS